MVKVQKLSQTEGFIVWDVEGAEASAGVVRLAPKVLRDGAELLARSYTYSFASFGLSGRAGASAAINAKPEDRDTAVTAWVDEVRPLADADQLRLWPGLGMTAEDLASLGWDAPDPALTAQGALAAAGAVLAADDADGVADRKVAIVGSGPVTEAAASLAKDAGAELVDTRYDADADVLMVAGKAGCLDHHTAEGVQARVVVPLSPVPVTARALAILGRAGSVVVPDFVSTAAPLLAAHDPDGGDPVERIDATVRKFTSEGTGLWLAAAVAAEEHLATWTEERPFGRPLA
jgi:hypothetical protein